MLVIIVIYREWFKINLPYKILIVSSTLLWSLLKMKLMKEIYLFIYLFIYLLIFIGYLVSHSV